MVDGLTIDHKTSAAPTRTCRVKHETFMSADDDDEDDRDDDNGDGDDADEIIKMCRITGLVKVPPLSVAEKVPGWRTCVRIMEM